jgi:hypothetical protein
MLWAAIRRCSWITASSVLLLCNLASAWLPTTTRLRHQHYCRGQQALFASFAKNPRSEKEDEEDWRDVRAKLVLQYRGGTNTSTSTNTTTTTTSNSTSTTSTSWAYESGDVIERGSLIVSNPIQDFTCGGLRQQYFYKCVVLVVEHDPNSWTKGIILNRPTDFTIGNDLTQDWKFWFGGDVNGMNSEEEPSFTCLHRLESALAKDLSDPVVKDIQVCAVFIFG